MPAFSRVERVSFRVVRVWGLSPWRHRVLAGRGMVLPFRVWTVFCWVMRRAWRAAWVAFVMRAWGWLRGVRVPLSW